MSQHPNHSDDEEDEEEDARELKLGKAFASADTLDNTSVAIILKTYMETKQKTDANYQLNPMLKLAEEYAKRFRITHNREVAEQITSMLLERNMQPFERAAIQNLCPETIEEARALVPSLFAEEGGMPEDEMQQMLDDVSTLRANQ
jgi:DNA-directed RNA polymerase II subunit RPB4